MTNQILNSLDWHGQRLVLREAVQQDVPRLVQLHRAIVGETPPAEQMNKPEAWFRLGGPWMHPYFCERHLKAYQDLGFDVWVLTRENDDLVGNIELWYDDEPEPFGRYAHMELLEMWRIVLNPQAADWPLNTPFWASRVNFEDGKWGICLVTVWSWLNNPPAARADLWVPVDLADDQAHIRRLLSISARKALDLGADSLVAYLPRDLAGQLADDDIEERALDVNDVWYLKHLMDDGQGTSVPRHSSSVLATKGAI
jgi:hypothetical protein